MARRMGSTFGSSGVQAGVLMIALAATTTSLSAQAKPGGPARTPPASAAPAADAGVVPEAPPPTTPPTVPEAAPAPPAPAAALQPSAAAQAAPPPHENQPPLRAASPAEDAATSAEAAASYRAANTRASRAASGPRSSYGWQVLLVDVAGLVAGVGVAASVENDASPFGMVAATWYGVGLLGAPPVHYGNGNWPLGMASFGFRALVPPLIGVSGLVSACLSENDFNSDCSRTGWAAGTLFGLAGAAAFDALVLAPAHAAAPMPSGSWYGLQILAVDAIGYAIGAFFTMREPREGREKLHPALSLWVMDYLVGTIGAPIVHFVHGNIGIGFASLGVRLIIGPMGALFGLIGACAATAGADDCAAEGAQYGLLGGSVVVALFDALVFAHEPASNASASSLGVSIGAGSIGLNGSF